MKIPRAHLCVLLLLGIGLPSPALAGGQIEAITSKAGHLYSFDAFTDYLSETYTVEQLDKAIAVAEVVDLVISKSADLATGGRGGSAAYGAGKAAGYLVLGQKKEAAQAATSALISAVAVSDGGVPDAAKSVAEQTSKAISAAKATKAGVGLGAAFSD